MKRQNTTLTLVLLLAFAATVPSLAMDWAQLVKQAQARHAKFQAEVKDMSIQQVMESVTEQGKIKSQMTVYSKGNKSRVEIQTDLGSSAPAGMGSMETIVIGDGSDYWLISPMMGSQKLPRQEGEKYQTGHDWWERLTSEARVVGEEKVSGRACYVVEGKPKEDSPFSKLWVDKEGLFLVKAEGKTAGQGNQMSIINSDFRPAHGGFLLPYRTEIYLDGKLTSTVKVTSVKANTGLADDLFDPKKAKAKGPGMEEMMKMFQRQRP